MNVFVVLPLSISRTFTRKVVVSTPSSRGVLGFVCGSRLLRSRPIDVSWGVKFTSPTFGSESVLTGQRSTPQVAAD